MCDDDSAHASGLRECRLSILNQFCHLSYRLGAKTDTFTKKRERASRPSNACWRINAVSNKVTCSSE